MVGCGLSSYTVQEKKVKGPYTVTWMVGVGWCFNLVLSLDLVLAWLICNSYIRCFQLCAVRIYGFCIFFPGDSSLYLSETIFLRTMLGLLLIRIFNAVILVWFAFSFILSYDLTERSFIWYHCSKPFRGILDLRRNISHFLLCIMIGL